MAWNWELPDWPQFSFNLDIVAQQEKQFLLSVGGSFAYLKNIDDVSYNQFAVEILSTEGMKSARIEGETLDRQSLQSSIRRHFGLQVDCKPCVNKESRMAHLLCNAYEFFNKPLTHEMLWQWHSELFLGQSYIQDIGKYRVHSEPMQIVSHRYDDPKVFFEAPPSSKVFSEMTRFIEWFNTPNMSQSILGRAAICHVYFESIHPFEDGNGRIGRVLIEKVLSQAVGRPIVLSVSKVLEKRRKEYYSALEGCNKTLKVDHWVQFFAESVLQAQKDSMQLLYFLIVKSKMLTSLAGQINPRQEKVLLRVFEEGPTGFVGGLSAEKYISITKASRATATRDLMELVEKQAFLKTGVLRHTRYWLNLEYQHCH